jgi:ParB family transcriptional regulator, chromosome partitioning protein
VPVTAVRGDDGVVTQRVAARWPRVRSGLPASLPTCYRPAPPMRTPTRLSGSCTRSSLTTRGDLTDAQRARGMQQMLDAGVSATKVAKKLSMQGDS